MTKLSSNLQKDVTSASKPVEPLRALTGMRGLAAWWVVAYHFRDELPVATFQVFANFLAYGYLAVDLFFVLSGYVIALNYNSWFLSKPGAFRSYLEFLWLRFSRIYPVHFVLLLLFPILPLAAFLFSHHQLGNLQLPYYILSYFLVQGWGLVSGPAWNMPAWSISTEWFAYLIFPAVAYISGKICKTPLRSLSFVAAFLLPLGLISFLRSNPEGMTDFQWFGLARCLCEFTAGVGVFCLLGTSRPHMSDARLGLALAVCGIVLFVARPNLEYAVLPASFAALVFSLAQDRGVVAYALRGRWLQWLGQASYSTYICHYLIKLWINLAFVRPDTRSAYVFLTYTLAVLCASFILHTFVECPARIILRHRRQIRAPARRQRCHQI